jgi:hypothetical protein
MNLLPHRSRPPRERTVVRARRTHGRSRLRALARTALVVLACGLGIITAVPARAQTLDEYTAKALFLVRFMQFGEWPETAFPGREAPFVLCIAGRDPFGAALAPHEGKPLPRQNRPLRVRRGVAADDLAGCHMLFVAESEERRMSVYVRAAGDAPVLLVSDIEGFPEAGGAIGLYIVDSRPKFDVNVAAAGRGGIRIPSQVLNLARNVVGARRTQ